MSETKNSIIKITPNYFKLSTIDSRINLSPSVPEQGQLISNFRKSRNRQY